MSNNQNSISFHIRIPLDLYEDLEKKCGEIGCTKAAYIKQLIYNSLK